MLLCACQNLQSASKYSERKRPLPFRERPLPARATGLEPATTGSTVRYSNQLSYGPFLRETDNYRLSVT